MQRLYFITLIFSFLFLTACSYSTDFYIVNESNYPVEIEYKVKVYLQHRPTKIDVDQLKNRIGSSRYSGELSVNQYQYDKDTRTMKVQILPHEALWVSSISGYGGFNYQTAEYFDIQEINIKGPQGNVIHTDRQVLDAFNQVSETLCTLTYR